MNEKLKKIFVGIGIVISAIGAFFFGCYINGRRVRPSNDGIGELEKGIRELEKRKSKLEAGIARSQERQQRIEAGLDRIEGSSNRIDEHNKHIADGIQSAIETLRAAKERSGD